MILVADDLAVAIDAGSHFSQVRGPVIVPAVLVGAHELDADWSGHDLGHDRRRLRGILEATLAECAGTFVVANRYLLHR